jgi:hypothetical protein
MYQLTASTIPKYLSSMNMHSAVVESLKCGQMKTLTRVNAVFWLRTDQRLRLSLTTVQISNVLEERLGKDRVLINVLIHRHHNSA